MDKIAVAKKMLTTVGPPVGSRWRHFKGGFYRITKLSVFEEDCDLLVTYVNEADPDGGDCTRRLSVFLDVHPEYKVKRFEQVD